VEALNRHFIFFNIFHLGDNCECLFGIDIVVIKDLRLEDKDLGLRTRTRTCSPRTCSPKTRTRTCKLVLEDKDFPRGQHWVTVKNSLLSDI